MMRQVSPALELKLFMSERQKHEPVRKARMESKLPRLICDDSHTFLPSRFKVEQRFARKPYQMSNHLTFSIKSRMENEL